MSWAIYKAVCGTAITYFNDPLMIPEYLNRGWRVYDMQGMELTRHGLRKEVFE